VEVFHIDIVKAEVLYLHLNQRDVVLYYYSGYFRPQVIISAD
jgi:hypothetical protein